MTPIPDEAVIATLPDGTLVCWLHLLPEGTKYTVRLGGTGLTRRADTTWHEIAVFVASPPVPTVTLPCTLVRTALTYGSGGFPRTVGIESADDARQQIAAAVIEAEGGRVVTADKPWPTAEQAAEAERQDRRADRADARYNAEGERHDRIR